MRKIKLSLVLASLLAVGQVFAALPPRSEEDMNASAQFVLSVYVHEVEELVVPGRNYDTTNYKARVEVINTEKGNLAVGQMVTLRFRKVSGKGGWCGPVGQNTILQAGEQARIFAFESANGLVLLEPNGAEVLD